MTLLFVTPSALRQRWPLAGVNACIGASDPNDFTVRKSRARQSLLRVHRSLSLICDDGLRPSGGTGWRESYVCFARRGQRNIFALKGWTYIVW